MFEKEFLKEQEELLEKEKQEITDALASFSTKDKEDKDNWNTSFPKMDEGEDIEDASNEVEEFSDLLPAEYALEIKLKNINQALDKIKKGTYGLCEECGLEIEKERLQINPSAKKCVNCLNNN